MNEIAGTAVAWSASFTTPPSRAPEAWFAGKCSMWPLAARECLVRNPLNGATARLDPDQYALLDACAGAKPLAAHEADLSARFNVAPSQRPAIRACLQRFCAAGLLVAMGDLVRRFGADRPPPSDEVQVVVRTADRPDLLARLLRSAQQLQERTGVKRAWHVIDDSRQPDSRARNRAALAQHRNLDCALHDDDAMHALQHDLERALPEASHDIQWLLGRPGGDAPTYGRPINFALLRFAGQRLLAIDDDASLEPRSPPVHAAGFGISSGNDELYAYASEGELWEACAPAGLDPLAEHERWLGQPLAHAWRTAQASCGEAVTALAAEDVARFTAAARVLFTQNHAIGDPGSALLPFHVLCLPPDSLAHVTAEPRRQSAALSQRHDWRGVPRLRLAPRRLLTFTTAAGLDNRELLPPTVPTYRNEDLLLGGVAQLLYPAGWFADLPFGLPHRRASAKAWLGPEASFAQEPLHFLLDQLEERSASIAAADAASRLESMAGVLVDLARTGERELAERIEAHAIDAATRVIFAVRCQLDDPAVPASWKDALRPWLASPALAIEGPALAARVVSTATARELCARYAGALSAWPALWAHRQGQNA